MKHLFIFFLLITFPKKNLLGNFSLKEISASPTLVQSDLELILEKANLPKDLIQFEYIEDKANYSKIICKDNFFTIEIYAKKTEWSSVFYHALQKLGFLFPHPRMQISPEKISNEFCGKIFNWQPALKYRGFHLHTMHPSEWVHGFMMNEVQIAYETIRWLARNQQNIFDFNLQRTNKQ